MNKTTFAAISFGIAAAFTSAQAQSLNDPADQAGYGPMPAAVTTRAAAATPVAAKPAAQAASKTGFFAALTSRSVSTTDAVDQAGYGAMEPAAGVSLRTRAEVRAEAIAARDAGMEAIWREGGDPQYAILNRGRTIDTAHMVAGAPAKSAK